MPRIGPRTRPFVEVTADYGRMSNVKPLRIVGYLGRALLTVGVLVLLFVAFQLWGTGLHESKAQKDLNTKFDQMLAAASSTVPPTTSMSQSTGPTTTIPAKTVAASDIAPGIGDPVGRLEIPKLHLDKIVVQGVSLTQLDRAPGHFPQTPFPGQLGNAAIAGHRTTYGAPFFNINKLVPGDKIYITTIQGRFTYAVQWAKIVQPTDVWVLDTAPDHKATLTLSACHPRLDLTQRYIVRAVLQGTPAPRFAGQEKSMKHFAQQAGNTIAGGVAAASDTGAWFPTLLWGLLCAFIWIIAWLIAKRSRRKALRILPYLVGLPFFLGALFFAFENLSRMLPAGL